MSEISEEFTLRVMEECSFEDDQQKYLNHLEEIRKQREKNVCHIIPYVKVESPKVAYLYESDEEVYPVYTESDGYGKVHIWVIDGIYNAGVEIERRYIGLGDKLLPKIKEYDSIPDCIVEKIIKGLVNEKN